MGREDDEGAADKGDETESGVTAADTPRTRGQANLASLPTRFSVKGTLGEGGMGTVVEAYDRALGRDVAIKVLAKDAAGDASINARFVREARAAAQLRHPGIVQVHDIDPDGEYIVMELVKGESLSALIKRERKLPASEVRRIGGALLEALGVAHAAGIVHRDVKPANVLLGERGEVKLSDFGVAFFGDSDLTMPGTRIGTPAYMAPEQLRARHVDARADVYAAGATLFEAATGKRLHDDDTLKDVAAAVLATTNDATLANAIARAVNERPADRFADGDAFARALEGPTVTEVVPQSARVPRRGAFVAGVVVALVIGGAVVAMRGGSDVPAPEAGSGSAPAKRTKTIALLPFVDATLNPLLDFAVSGLPNLLGLELHEVPGVDVLGYYQLLGNVDGASAPIAAWREAALRLGADVIVRGELSAKGDRVHVVIRIETAAGEQLDVVEQDARVEEVPETVRTAAGRVASATVGQQRTGARVPTAFAADRELQLGIAALERERMQEAIVHLRAAVHHAPDLKLAHYYLAVALYWNAPPAGPAREEIDKALALGLDEAQRGFLSGIRHIVGQDFVKGIEELRPLAEKYPANKDILYGLFEALFHGGRPSEAMSVYRRLIKLVPRFRLALVHAFTYYVSHGDDAGTSWALALGDPTGDAYNRIWEPRILLARRDYAAAIKLLTELTNVAGEVPGNVRALQGELVTAYVLDDKLDLAVALMAKLGEVNLAQTATARLAVATARGDAAGRARWRSIALRDLATQTPGAGHTISLTMFAIQELPVATKAEVTELSKAIEGSIVEEYDRSLNLNVAQAMIADVLDDPATLAKLAKSQYPEVSELVAASLARRAGDRKLAAAAMRRAIAASGDARFIIHMWYLLAGDLRALSDHSGVIATCDEVIRARLFSWQWGSTVGECLAWPADASAAKGSPDEARAAWTRILGLRTAAPADDRLVRAAKAGLARLPKR